MWFIFHLTILTFPKIYLSSLILDTITRLAKINLLVTALWRHKHNYYSLSLSGTLGTIWKFVCETGRRTKSECQFNIFKEIRLSSVFGPVDNMFYILQILRICTFNYKAWKCFYLFWKCFSLCIKSGVGNQKSLFIFHSANRTMRIQKL